MYSKKKTSKLETTIHWTLVHNEISPISIQVEEGWQETKVNVHKDNDF